MDGKKMNEFKLGKGTNAATTEYSRLLT